MLRNILTRLLVASPFAVGDVISQYENNGNWSDKKRTAVCYTGGIFANGVTLPIWYRICNRITQKPLYQMLCEWFLYAPISVFVYCNINSDNLRDVYKDTLSTYWKFWLIPDILAYSCFTNIWYRCMFISSVEVLVISRLQNICSLKTETIQ